MKTATSAPTPSQPPAAALLDQLHGTIEPVPTTLAYRLGLVLVAPLMVLLPLAYAGVVALVAVLTYYYATHVIDFLPSLGHGRASIYLTILSLAPIVGGIVACAFMLKPLVPHPSKKPLLLDRSEEPELFAYAERLARAVGAPPPTEIELTMDVNAAAGFRRGLRSFRDKDMVLVLGLPLVAGLTVRQLSGVLAHEFGHFTQGAAMKLGYIVRTVNFWLARAVYEKDSWDDMLLMWSHTRSRPIAILAGTARGCVWLSQRVLWVLMQIGVIMSCFLSRQQEYDADKYEARVAGSDSFSQTFRRMAILAAASHAAHNDLSQMWEERRLCDDLTQFTLHKAAQMPRAIAKDVETSLTEESTGLFDTHPCFNDRVRNVADEPRRGLVTIQGPGTALFRDFDKVSRSASLAFFHSMLGGAALGAQLVAVDRTQQSEQKVAESQTDALRRFWQDALAADCAVVPHADALQPAADPAAEAMSLRVGRTLFEELLGPARPAITRRPKAEKALVKAIRTQAMLDAGFTLRAGPGRGSVVSAADIQRKRAETQADAKARAACVRPLAEAGIVRLRSALRLLNTPGAVDGLAGADALRLEAQKLLAALIALEPALPVLLDLRRQYAELDAVLGVVRRQPTVPEPTLVIVRARTGAVRENIQRLRMMLSRTEYPFAHEGDRLTIARYGIGELDTQTQNVGNTMETAEAAMDRLYELYFRAMGRLSEMAEQVEKAMGLDPLPDPPPADEASEEDAAEA